MMRGRDEDEDEDADEDEEEDEDDDDDVLLYGLHYKTLVLARIAHRSVYLWEIKSLSLPL